MDVFRTTDRKLGKPIFDLMVHKEKWLKNALSRKDPRTLFQERY